MRALLSAALFAAVSGAAYAQDCQMGSQLPVSIEGWSASIGEIEIFGRPEETVEMEIIVGNQTGNEIIAIESDVSFYDPLNRFMFSIAVPDIPKFEDGILTISGSYGGNSKVGALSRLPADSVTSIICTKKIAYADGTIETFD